MIRYIKVFIVLCLTAPSLYAAKPVSPEVEKKFSYLSGKEHCDGVDDFTCTFMQDIYVQKRKGDYFMAKTAYGVLKNAYVVNIKPGDKNYDIAKKLNDKFEKLLAANSDIKDGVEDVFQRGLLQGRQLNPSYTLSKIDLEALEFFRRYRPVQNLAPAATEATDDKPNAKNIYNHSWGIHIPGSKSASGVFIIFDDWVLRTHVRWKNARGRKI